MNRGADEIENGDMLGVHEEATRGDGKANESMWVESDSPRSQERSKYQKLRWAGRGIIRVVERVYKIPHCFNGRNMAHAQEVE